MSLLGFLHFKRQYAPRVESEHMVEITHIYFPRNWCRTILLMTLVLYAAVGVGAIALATLFILWMYNYIVSLLPH